MAVDVGEITRPEVRRFFELYLPHRQVIRHFYELLPDDKLDYRMLDTNGRRSDSPRESLVHILETQLAYFNGIKSGSLSWDEMGAEQHRSLDKQQLLSELAALDEEMYRYTTRPEFDPTSKVENSGDETALSVLYLIRDHDILHTGWNLALIDHLGLERYPSLADIWG